MRVYGISDLHLAKDIDKSMDVFGVSWDNYMERIETNWRSVVKDDDIVLLPGDISWATYINEIDKDFDYIEKLPGTKIISRGNHDYWWTTLRKLENYLETKDINSIRFVQNKAMQFNDVIVTGTRGWILPNDVDFDDDDKRIFEREVLRLKLCIDDVNRMDPEHKCKWILMIHYPPILKTNMHNEIVNMIVSANFDYCVYGHLHGLGHKLICEDRICNTDFKCISADYLRFKPLLLY